MARSIKTINLPESFRRNSLVRTIGRSLLKSLNLHKPTTEKRRILQKASALLEEKISLDFTIRNGFTVFHNRGNTLIARGAPFEPEVQECLCCLLFLDRLRGNTPRFGDIGANIGLHTLHLKQRFPELDIVAFDPSPYSWKYMELTLRYNNISDIALHKVALSDEDGTTELYSWGENSAGDSLRNTQRQPELPFELLPVKMVKFDTFSGTGHLTVIKMDCEGAEINILKGMQNLLKQHKPLIIAELNIINQQAFELDGDQVFTFIEEMGYCIYTIWFQQLNRHEFISFQEAWEENFVLLPSGFDLPLDLQGIRSAKH